MEKDKPSTMGRAKGMANMDKAKGIVKGGWHPPGDVSVSRKTWKSDLKGIAKGDNEKKKHYQTAMNHQSQPLGSLKDPDSFGPPPKHKEYYDEQGNSLNPASPTSVTRYGAPDRPAQRPQPSGGLGSVAPSPSRRQTEQEQKQSEEEARAARGPYQVNTTGLRTDNLPPPPVRRDGPAPVPPPRSHASPASPPLPSRQPQARAAPIPTLPPRMNEHPNEYTPPAPPPYSEATAAPQQNPASLNAAAVSRLGQAGVSIPGFGIGGNPSSAPQTPTSPTGHVGQLSELQQRFARLGTRSDVHSQAPASTTSSSSAAAMAAHKKPPPPPPPKKAILSGVMPTPPGSSDGTGAPPPLPMLSKPRPS